MIVKYNFFFCDTLFWNIGEKCHYRQQNVISNEVSRTILLINFSLILHITLFLWEKIQYGRHSSSPSNLVHYKNIQIILRGFRSKCNLKHLRVELPIWHSSLNCRWWQVWIMNTIIHSSYTHYTIGIGTHINAFDITQDTQSYIVCRCWTRYTFNKLLNTNFVPRNFF